MSELEEAQLRLSADELKLKRTERRKVLKKVNKNRKRAGLKPLKSISNIIHADETVEEEEAKRAGATLAQAKIIKKCFPILLKRMSKIKDIRQPNKCRHKLTVLLFYGLLSMIFQCSSRRCANAEITQPMFVKTLKILFPNLESIPHHDTLNRVLSDIKVSQIEEILIDLARDWIRNKKFKNFLINGCYDIAVDGSQKLTSNTLWHKNCLQRKTSKKMRYYVYVLEANIVFHNGISIPLMSEFLKYDVDGKEAWKKSEGKHKQDCETKAFSRIAEKLKLAFPNLSIRMLLDGLYSNGPIIEICKKNNWQYMIVLKDDSLSTVWQEALALKKLQKNNTFEQNWKGRKQAFWWVNGIDYYYDHNKKHHSLHIVVCDETWETVNDKNEIEIQHGKHAWISSNPINVNNVHAICNLSARHRWDIELSFLEEKRLGYHYEHCFSKNWNAMMGYHYLMRLAHALNVFARHTKIIKKYVGELGLRRFVRFVRETIATCWRLIEAHKDELDKPCYFSLS